MGQFDVLGEMRLITESITSGIYDALSKLLVTRDISKEAAYHICDVLNHRLDLQLEHSESRELLDQTKKRLLSLSACATTPSQR